ncbi:MAG: radical SAM protein, partial [Planctomycetales bacterium]|nr:radical SAM protein [Planctomycetales bacterium]
MLKHRDYTFLGTTQSLCPDCLQLLPAKIISKAQRVYFRKQCPVHGSRDDFVCSDVQWYDRLEYSVPAKLPQQMGIEPRQGCPFDCGLCTEHEQHTCIGLVELTAGCNLNCPLCFAQSGPQGEHLSVVDCCRAIDRLVEVEGRPEVLQLSGGEPTLHPDFAEILQYALAQPIDYIMVNTNGVRLARDRQLLELLAAHRDRVEVYLQFDGLQESTQVALRGEPLLATKLQAVERCGDVGLHVTLVCTLQAGVNETEIGPLVLYGLERPWVAGISFQPATYSGRHFLPQQLESRITFPDVIHAIEGQTGGVFVEQDFFPLPCAHPNCHSLAYAYRHEGRTIPLTRFIDGERNLDLLANGISLNRPAARDIIEQYLGRLGCCSGTCTSGVDDREMVGDQSGENAVAKLTN